MFKWLRQIAYNGFVYDLWRFWRLALGSELAAACKAA